VAYLRADPPPLEADYPVVQTADGRLVKRVVVPVDPFPPEDIFIDTHTT
jgi:hypothetical protein